MGAATVPDLGDYEVLWPLAAGGMASIDLARHRSGGGVERLVVVKRIHPHLASQREHVEMFLDEARLASQIRHPNVVAVEDVVDSRGELFLVQPFVESVALATLLDLAAKSGERLPPSVVTRILADALAGLDGAHHTRDLRGDPLGIVHRDVSPHNLLVGTDGRCRVIDFGIATALRRIAVTRDGSIKGKVHYMSPEQLRRQPLDPRADVFAAGVVLYEALTGARPFEGDDEADTLLGILLGEPPPASTRVSGVPPALDAVIARALEVDRTARWPTAAELADAMEAAVPPAAPREVAALVERLAAERLADLRLRIRASLDAAPVEADAAAVYIKHSETGLTPSHRSALVADAPPLPVRARRLPITAVALVTALATGAAALVALRRPEPTAAPATSISTSTAPASTSTSSPSLPVPGAPGTPASTTFPTVAPSSSAAPSPGTTTTRPTDPASPTLPVAPSSTSTPASTTPTVPVATSTSAPVSTTASVPVSTSTSAPVSTTASVPVATSASAPAPAPPPATAPGPVLHPNPYSERP